MLGEIMVWCRKCSRNIKGLKHDGMPGIPSGNILRWLKNHGHTLPKPELAKSFKYNHRKRKSLV